ncbi:hypothetical protein M3D53_00525 [Dermabacter hominis]|uniref:hypothetical protein n=1 Tax=Dermabacter hominis TaxID=36740 RepID=UPI0021A25D39|nr:hypothetical protein [Dermabacter hominis]MCT2055139.1 hypothetical protein [Dermabacter hominis]MCT2083758.1 hypothetical protein [Dermabacter hominis]MCT2090844.1 hypothetical protein [Dermabacter hominis]MCT2189487.1 hypothetical protein [Dermabacter hominis]MCT2226171.1 hypothetical protein [Dermabacter hominis]
MNPARRTRPLSTALAAVLVAGTLTGCGAILSSRGGSEPSSSSSTSSEQPSESPKPAPAPPNSSGDPAPNPAPAPGAQDPADGDGATFKLSPTPFTEEEKQQAVKVTAAYIQARTESNWSVACELAAAESNGSYFVLESQIEKDACIRAANQNVPPVDPAKAQSIRQALDGAAFTVDDHGDGTAEVKSKELGMGLTVVKLESKGIYVRP